MKKLIPLLILVFLLTGCSYQIVKIEDVNNKVMEIEVESFLNEQGYYLINLEVVDINHNSHKDYIIHAMPKDCGSCHSRPFFIIEDGNIIFKYVGDDYQIVNIKNGKLYIKEPIRIDSEPYCCPSSFKTTIINCSNKEELSYCFIDY